MKQPLGLVVMSSNGNLYLEIQSATQPSSPIASFWLHVYRLCIWRRKKRKSPSFCLLCMHKDINPLLCAHTFLFYQTGPLRPDDDSVSSQSVCRWMRALAVCISIRPSAPRVLRSRYLKRTAKGLGTAPLVAWHRRGSPTRAAVIMCAGRGYL